MTSRIRRFDPTSRCGLVKWPDLPAGNGGCFVVAVFVKGHPDQDDPFVRCLEMGNIAMFDGEVMVWGAEGSDLWPPRPGGTCEGASVGLLAAVTLGSCGSAFDDQSSTWRASRSDLTAEGESLVSSLERLYGRPAIIATFIDT